MAYPTVQPGMHPANPDAHLDATGRSMLDAMKAHREQQDNPSATRRAMLGILAAPAVALALPTACYEAKAAERPEWDDAYAAYLRAKAASDTQEEVFKATRAEYESLLPSADMIEWREFPFEDRDYVAFALDLEARWQQFLDGEGVIWGSVDPQRRKERFRAALDKVAEYRRLRAEASARSGHGEAFDRADELFSELCTAEERLFLTPAPDAQALLWKLTNAITWDGDGDDRYEKSSSPVLMIYAEAIIADVRRFAGEA